VVRKAEKQKFHNHKHIGHKRVNKTASRDIFPSEIKFHCIHLLGNEKRKKNKNLKTILGGSGQSEFLLLPTAFFTNNDL
jgi:hypothetical protein